jgi:hypothetical protein
MAKRRGDERFSASFASLDKSQFLVACQGGCVAFAAARARSIGFSSFGAKLCVMSKSRCGATAFDVLKGGPSRDAVVYFVIARVAALSNLSGRYAINLVLPFEFAVVLAYMAGMAVGFLLIHLMLIRGRQHISAGQVYRNILVNVFRATLARGAELSDGAPGVPAFQLDRVSVRDCPPRWRGGGCLGQLFPEPSLHFARAGEDAETGLASCRSSVVVGAAALPASPTMSEYRS